MQMVSGAPDLEKSERQAPRRQILLVSMVDGWLLETPLC